VGVHQLTSAIGAMIAMCASECRSDCTSKKSGKKCKSVESNEVSFCKAKLRENVKVNGEKSKFSFYGLFSLAFLSSLLFYSLNPKPLLFYSFLFLFSSLNPKP
jgi:hypothetical protein